MSVVKNILIQTSNGMFNQINDIMLSYSIRLMTPTDVQQCVNIVNLNSNNKYIHIERELQAMFQKDVWIQPKYYVMETESKIISFGGYSLSSIDYNCYGILWMNTHPDYQNKGFASMIVSTIINAIKSETIESKKSWIILSCKEKLKNFYGKFGFVPLLKRPKKGGYMMSLNLW